MTKTLVKYRPDLDGLRGISIALVVIYHAIPGITTGGFVGVDVFFVISGFLITGVILDALVNNRFSFFDFYARRIRRIFPSLIIMLATCYAFGWFAFIGDEYREFGKYVAGSAGFIANLLCWNEVGGYFHGWVDRLPLLNLWSLGIEEQFYIAFPLLIFILWRLRIKIGWCLAILFLVSFAANIVLYAKHPVAVFYSPLTRAWELLAGGLLAVAFRNLDSFAMSRIVNARERINEVALNACLPNNIRTTSAGVPLDKEEIRGYFAARLSKGLIALVDVGNVVSIAGLYAILYAAIKFTNNTRFPYWAALLPVIGSCLIICSRPTCLINRFVLSNRLLVWVGLISYPLYLWHWPVQYFVKTYLVPIYPHYTSFIVIALSLGFTVLTYYLFEKPMRFGMRPRRAVIILSCLMALVGLTGYLTYKHDGLKFRYPEYEKPWNTVKLSGFLPLNHSNVGVKMGGGDPTVLCIGDSHSACVSLELGKALLESGENLAFLNVTPNREFFTGMPETPTIVLIAYYHYNHWDFSPDATGHTTLRLRQNRLVDPLPYAGMTDREYEDLLRERLVNALDFLASTGKRVIFVVDVPRMGKSPIQYLPVPLRKPTETPWITRETHDKQTKLYMDVFAPVLAKYPNVEIFDPTELFCDGEKCYANKDGITYYYDDNHVSATGAKLLAEALAAFITGTQK